MQAACLIEPRKFEWRNAADLVPQGNQVLIRVAGCGVCSSNLGPWKGAPWFTYPLAPGAPGHEAFGVIAATGPSANKTAVGARVATLSQNAFAEYCLASESDITVLPSLLADRIFLGEPLACAVNIFKRAQIRAGQDIAIVGIGFLGALLVQLASRSGARVIATARRPESLDLAVKEGASDAVCFADFWAGVQSVRQLTNDRLCDVTIEATGAQTGLDFASEITGERGRLVIAGYHQDGPRTINLQSWNWRGLDVINAHERDPRIYHAGMEEALQKTLEGFISSDELITHRFRFAQINEAFGEAESHRTGFVKAIVLADW
jgi:threonine dehydrogenase-like Zn-dependent dehydrogenase